MLLKRSAAELGLCNLPGGEAASIGDSHAAAEEDDWNFSEMIEIHHCMEEELKNRNGDLIVFVPDKCHYNEYQIATLKSLLPPDTS